MTSKPCFCIEIAGKDHRLIVRLQRNGILTRSGDGLKLSRDWQNNYYLGKQTSAHCSIPFNEVKIRFRHLAH